MGNLGGPGCLAAPLASARLAFDRMALVLDLRRFFPDRRGAHAIGTGSNVSPALFFITVP